VANKSEGMKTPYYNLLEKRLTTHNYAARSDFAFFFFLLVCMLARSSFILYDNLFSAASLGAFFLPFLFTCILAAAGTPLSPI
jgi:Ni,Fe-hydrogenase I cytochrome b subunit